MENKKLGVIGGMGPLATKIFYEKTIKNTVASKDQEHIDMIILNHATMPERTEAILEGKESHFLDAIKRDFELLEMSGVNNIAIPCNTSHYFYKQMQEITTINIINMIACTAKHIYSQYGEGSKVAILATDGTVSTGIYQTECLSHRLVPYSPKEIIQEKIMKMIYKVKAGADYKAEELESMIIDLVKKKHCTCVLLGCTELSSVKLKKEVKKYCVDPLEILVDTSIKLSGKKSKLNILQFAF